jgi:hypothetical protein
MAVVTEPTDALTREARKEAAKAITDPRERANRLARAIIQGLLMAALGIALFLHFFNARFSGLTNWEAIDAAQVGLNFAKGRGLVTSVVYPLAIALKHPDTGRADIRQCPLYPMFLSFFFRAKVAGDETVAMANGVLHLFTAWMLYLLIKLLYDKATGLVAVIAYLFSLEAIGQALTGTGASLGGLLLLVSLLCWAQTVSEAQHGNAVSIPLARRPLSNPWLWLVASGLSLGLLYLSGQFAIATIGAIAWFTAISQRPNHKFAIAVLLALFILTLCPWLIRNYRTLHTFGLPLKQYELVMHTRSFPGHSILWTMPDPLPHPVTFVLSHPKQMLIKFANGLTGLYRAIPDLVSPYLWPFLALGYFLVLQTDLQRRTWRLVALAVLLQALTICFYDVTNVSPLHVFIPVAYGLAVAAAVQFVRQFVSPARARIALVTGVAALVVFPYVTSTALGGKVPASPSATNLGILANAVHSKDMIASDIAWDVAWYAERKTLLLPRDAPEFKRLVDAGYKPAYVYLSRSLIGARRYGLGREVWVAMLTGRLNPARIGLGLPLPMPNGELLIELPFAQYRVSERLKKAAERAKGENR